MRALILLGGIKMKPKELLEILSVAEMESNEEVWQDWLKQENEYAIGDRKSMNAGGEST